MSRAFVKEPDGDQAETDVLERPQSRHPNYITLQGLEGMKLRVESLRQQQTTLKAQADNLTVKNQIKMLEADLRYLEKRIQSAIPVNVATQTGNEIRFGATVKLVDKEDTRYEFTIVGEDEANADKKSISWVSPLARELLGKKAGDIVIWQRPAGDLELDILSVNFKSGRQSD